MAWHGSRCHSHTCIACLSRVRHQGVLVQLSRLVVGCLENRCASHRGLGCRDQGKVLASDSEQDLPVVSAQLAIAYILKLFGLT